jgi:hypothetical protein
MLQKEFCLPDVVYAYAAMAAFAPIPLMMESNPSGSRRQEKEPYCSTHAQPVAPSHEVELYSQHVSVIETAIDKSL